MSWRVFPAACGSLSFDRVDPARPLIDGAAQCRVLGCLERMAGIEPAPRGWKPRVLPLNYIRRRLNLNRPVPVLAALAGCGRRAGRLRSLSLGYLPRFMDWHLRVSRRAGRLSLPERPCLWLGSVWWCCSCRFSVKTGGDFATALRPIYSLSPLLSMSGALALACFSMRAPFPVLGRRHAASAVGNVWSAPPFLGTDRPV